MLVSINIYAQNMAHDKDVLLEYYQSQRFDDAYNYLHSVYTPPINDNKILKTLAYTSQMSGKLFEAERYYLQILETDSANIAVLYIVWVILTYDETIVPMHSIITKGYY